MDINVRCRYMSTCVLLQYYTKMVPKQISDFSEQSLGNEKTAEPSKPSSLYILRIIRCTNIVWLV